MSVRMTDNNLGFRPQKELCYTKLLPFKDQLEEESLVWLVKIKENLGRAVMLREIKPACVFWTKQLYMYIEVYGLKFSKEDHITFVKLTYEIFTIPKLNSSVIIMCSNLLQVLLKKKELISPDELELPWRPLYEMLYTIKRPKLYRFSGQLQNSIYTLTRVLNTYFPLSATQEILDELRPTLCPFDEAVMGRTLSILENLLPTKLRPQHHSVGHHLWFDELLSIWKVCHNAPYWENTILCLMGRLALDNIGYIDWSPHLPVMFSRFTRCLHLPVTYKNTDNKKHKFDISSICMWIVGTLGNGSDAQMYLDKFLKTVETYSYPANFGRWTGKLTILLSKLTYHFLARLRRERYYHKPTWQTSIPDNYKLTDDDIDAFVKSVLPLAMTVIYHKQKIFDKCTALRLLALIRPNLVIPDMLERMYSSFDSLTEPHKLITLITCMSFLAKQMVQGPRYMNGDHAFTEGPMHVLSLLFLSLPGIDANDLRKCYLTLTLIGAYCGFISLVDCSKSTAEMTEDERIICEGTSRFEDFVLQFLDRVFLVIEACSLENDSNNMIVKSNLDIFAQSLLKNTCAVVLLDTSKSIFDSALHKLRTFMTERIFETEIAGQLAKAVCRGFAVCNGRETLRVLLPTLAQTILSLVNEMEDVSKEYNLDQRLLYTLLILTAVVDTTGDNLLPYMDTLYEILDHVLYLRSKNGNEVVCNLLQEILKHLSTITMYPPKKIISEDPDYCHIRDWGKGVNVDKFDAKWYIPGEAELAAVQQIFSRYLTVQIDKLKKYCEDPSTLTPEELRISLNIIKHVLLGATAFLPVWTETPLVIVESSVERNVSVPRQFGKMGCVTMPDGSNVRQYLAGIMSQVQRTMLDNGEDDTKSFDALIYIWKSLLLGNLHQQEYLADRLNDFHEAKKMFENKLEGNKTRVLRLLHNRCMVQLHIRELARIKNSCILTEIHKQIIMELFALATSRYASVRSSAQLGLFSAFRYFPYSYKFLVPHICDILAKDTEIHHNACKGVLYILFGEDVSPILVKEDWNLLKTLWPAVVLSKPSEKISLRTLKECLIQVISTNFATCTIELEVPDRCLTVARALWEHSPQPTLPQPDENMIQSGLQSLKKLNESNVAAYNGLLDELLRCISEKCLHWRHRLMAMGFIRDMIHPDQNYPAQVVRYFLQALIHDSVEERKIATKVVAYMLRQQKRKHLKVEVNLDSLVKENTLSKENQLQLVTPGIRADNSWLQYNYETRPLTAEQWDEPRYVHQVYTGYYVWPKVLKVYAPSSQQPCLDPATRELTDCEKEVHLFFDNPQNIENLINYFSLEEVKGKLDPCRCLLFKGLFCNHGIVHLKHFLPHLQRLVEDKQHESSQRCAAEIVTGLIRGAKHWPFQMTSDMWQAILPVIRTAITNVTEETFVGWSICFLKSQEHRDPNRYHWLLECLMEDSPSEETSFRQTARLCMLQSTLCQASWRKTELLRRLLTRIEDRILTNLLQNVRETLGSVLTTIFMVDIKSLRNSSDSMTPRIETLINKIMPHLNQLITNNHADESENSEKTKIIVEKVSNLSLDEANQVSKEDDIRKGMLKTVCKWIQCNVHQVLYSAMPEFYQLFPIICQLGTSENDKELHDLCLRALGSLAQVLILPEDMSTILTTVKTTSEHLSWSVRLDCLEYLQVLVFHNMSIILSDNTWIDCIKDIVLRLLEDDRLEVREKAGQVLSGLLHCTFITDYDELLEEFKKKTKTRLHKRKSPNEDSSRNASSAIRLRHAGVLGLCAFITAHPYDVPKYVPPIFEHLSHHMNDPQPIPMTIRNTLNDFKRTHYENWTGINGHAQHFTDEQLDVLQTLTIPPSHYA